MSYYRITKYNPGFRDVKGYYTANDWTSVSDIGNVFSDGVLTKEKYLETENTYIQAINVILNENNISEMIVTDLEKYEDNTSSELLSSDEKKLFFNISDNMCVKLYEIQHIARMNLREILWCRLLSRTENLEIEFGYDYYMYIRCNEIPSSIKRMIFDLGLYIELLL